jgi:hypothetical protein
MILCLIVTAGCGSSTTAQFKTGYAAAVPPLNRTLMAVTETFAHDKGKSVSQIARSFGDLADRFGKELAPLEALKPPASVAPDFATLTSSLNRVERDLRGPSVAVKHRDVLGVALALESLPSDAGAAADASAAIAEKLDHK